MLRNGSKDWQCRLLSGAASAAINETSPRETPSPVQWQPIFSSLACFIHLAEPSQCPGMAQDIIEAWNSFQLAPWMRPTNLWEEEGVQLPVQAESCLLLSVLDNGTDPIYLTDLGPGRASDTTGCNWYRAQPIRNSSLVQVNHWRGLEFSKGQFKELTLNAWG